MFKGIGSTMPSPVIEKKIDQFKNLRSFSNYDLCRTFKEANSFCYYICTYVNFLAILLLVVEKSQIKSTFRTLQMYSSSWPGTPSLFWLVCWIAIYFFQDANQLKENGVDRYTVSVMKTALLQPSVAFSLLESHNLTKEMKIKINCLGQLTCQLSPRDTLN